MNILPVLTVITLRRLRYPAATLVETQKETNLRVREQGFIVAFNLGCTEQASACDSVCLFPLCIYKALGQALSFSYICIMQETSLLIKSTGF